MRPQHTFASDWFEADAAGTTNSAALTAPSAKATSTDRPATDASSGRFVFNLRDLPGSNGDQAAIARAVDYLLAFAVQDADGETAGWQAWVWRPVGGEWVPELRMVGTLAAGSRTGAAGGTLEDWYLADTIAVSEDNTPGESAEVLAAAAGNGLAALRFDPGGPGLLEIEVSVTTAAAVRALLAAM